MPKHILLKDYNLKQAAGWQLPLGLFTLILFPYIFTQDQNVKKEMRDIWKPQWKGQVGSDTPNKQCRGCWDNGNGFYGSLIHYFLEKIRAFFSYFL